MEKLKIGIVEDEAIIADNLSQQLQSMGYQVPEPVASYMEALEMIEAEKPDLLILDIQIKGKRDGIELALKIREDYQIPFIFLTANADANTIERAKETNPPAYLIKPFSKDELFAAIEICIHNFSINQSLNKKKILQDSIFIKDGAYFIKVEIKDIVYLESDHVYVKVHSKDKSFLVRKSMQQYLENFDSNVFFRTHRGFVINTNYIDAINSETVIVNGINIPISRGYREELLNQLKL